MQAHRLFCRVQHIAPLFNHSHCEVVLGRRRHRQEPSGCAALLAQLFRAPPAPAQQEALGGSPPTDGQELFLPQQAVQQTQSASPTASEPPMYWLPDTRPFDYPYELRRSVLSAAELHFLQVLWHVVGNRVVVLSKVRLADIFVTRRPNDYRSFNQIAQKHIDFLLCHPATMQPLAGLELDDRSHQRRDRQDRDVFVNNAFAAAGLPLLRFRVQARYNHDEIAAMIVNILPQKP
jgi:hypothetical protein